MRTVHTWTSHGQKESSRIKFSCVCVAKAVIVICNDDVLYSVVEKTNILCGCGPTVYNGSQLALI